MTATSPSPLTVFVAAIRADPVQSPRARREPPGRAAL